MGRERGDYVTESENCHPKNHLSPDVSTPQSWIISSRNHQKFVKNCQGVFRKVGFTYPESSSLFNNENEVTVLRIAIRKSGILSHPYERFPIKSLEGNLLHPNLIYFYQKALENNQHTF